MIVAHACQLSIQRGEAVAVEECVPEGIHAVADGAPTRGDIPS